MRKSMWLLGLVALATTGCRPAANVDREREALLQRDREWSQSSQDIDKFMSFYAPDASTYAPGMPIATGPEAIRKMFTAMQAMPGFSIHWTADKAYVSSAGDLGYTAGAYEATMGGGREKGKYVTIWKKQPDGQWKSSDDIFNADAPPQAPAAAPVINPADEPRKK